MRRRLRQAFALCLVLAGCAATPSQPPQIVNSVAIDALLQAPKVQSMLSFIEDNGVRGVFENGDYIVYAYVGTPEVWVLDGPQGEH